MEKIMLRELAAQLDCEGAAVGLRLVYSHSPIDALGCDAFGP
jgi:hypothetical protein